MAVATPEELCMAVIAPDVDLAQCVTGAVVVDQHKKDVETLHAQLKYMTMLETSDRRQIRIASHIADGTWSSVYLVSEGSGLMTALKVIPIEGANVDSAYADIELLKQLSHPNIVQYHRHFTHHINEVTCLCIQLGLCSKGALVDFIRGRHGSALSAARVRDFTTQLASALAYVHEHGHLHGDLRPESILLTAEKQLKLTSFGSPLWIDRWGLAPRTITGGCKAYAPPEWMHRESPHRPLQPLETPLPSYDMWSLGCVLSELVTLKLLRNDRRYLRTALAADPDGLQGITQEVTAAYSGLFAQLLGRLLETDPDTRATAPETLHLLQTLQSPKCMLPAFCRPLSHFNSPRQS
eukprot:EG_transcript_5103